MIKVSTAAEHAKKWFPPLGITIFLWVTGGHDVSLLAFSCSWLILTISWVSYYLWMQEERKEPPLVALITFAYWVSYGLPLFWADLISARPNDHGVAIPEQYVTSSIVLAAMGVIALWAGQRTGLARELVASRVVDLKPIGFVRWYVYGLLVVGMLLNYFDTAYLFGEGGRQFLLVAGTVVPLTGFCYLFRSIMQARASASDIAIVVAFVGGRFVTGMASGWLGSAGSLIVISILIFVQERGRFPKTGVIFLLGFVLFFQVGKGEFRNQYWYGRAENASMVERIQFWTSQSAEKWRYALEDSSGSEVRDLAYTAVGRFNLLPQTANVVELTPSVVPYQYGKLYSFFLVTWIPRMMWPDKPTVNEANRFYQVEYGMTSEANLGGVSIAVGALAEGFINFGWAGVAGIMFLVGIVVDLYRRTQLSKDAGLFLNAMGMALIPNFLTVESQLAQYLGGMVQMVALTILLYAPVLCLRRRSDIARQPQRPDWWNIPRRVARPVFATTPAPFATRE